MRIGEHRETLVGRMRVLFGLGGGLLALVAASYFYLQVVHGDDYLEMAENNRLRRLSIEAPRGTITDRNGRVLVENLPSYSLELDRSRSKSLAESVAFAAGALGRPADELAHVLERYRGTGMFQPVLLAENLALPQVSRFLVARLEHPEFEVEVTQRRFYRLGSYAAHALGYLGEVSAHELADGGGSYRAGDWIGRRGIELAFDKRLRGDDGERVVVVDSRGLPIEEFGRRLGRPGESLTTTLDADLQEEGERLMRDQVGAIVALDPTNGAIRALVSAPAFDPNLFSQRLDVDAWKALLDDPRHPLQDRALSSAYSPGSVFKTVIAAAGLAEGLITPGHTEFCGGATSFYGRSFHCWKKGGHGTVDLESALAHSCDVYFYRLGERLGIERIARYARLMGLGEKTGIELDGERRGLVPNDEWSRVVRHHPWYPGETISVAIGQGAINVTPIQMARMMAVFANGGRLVTPFLVEGEETPSRQLPLPPEVLASVRQGLWQVVNGPGGTGGNARVAGLDVAGKTGTTQIASQEAYEDSAKLAWEQRNHAWFAAYAPAAAPKLVVVVFVEHGGHSAVAAAIAKGLMERYFGQVPGTVTAAS